MQNTIPSVNELEQRSDDNRQHWSSSSQTYTPVNVLLEYLTDGWVINSVVGREACWRGGGRHITIYHFELTKNNQAVAMPVLGNPIVRRLVGQQQLRVVQRDLYSVWMLEASTRLAFLRPRPIHSAMNKAKLVLSSEAHA